MIYFQNIRHNLAGFSLYNRKSCTEGNLYTLPLQLTPPGTLTAHRRFFLWLLHSCPDPVRRFLLRKTQTSTPLTKGSYISSHPYRICSCLNCLVYWLFVRLSNHNILLFFFYCRFFFCYLQFTPQGLKKFRKHGGTFLFQHPADNFRFMIE